MNRNSVREFGDIPAVEVTDLQRAFELYSDALSRKFHHPGLFSNRVAIETLIRMWAFIDVLRHYKEKIGKHGFPPHWLDCASDLPIFRVDGLFKFRLADFVWPKEAARLFVVREFSKPPRTKLRKHAAK